MRNSDTIGADKAMSEALAVLEEPLRNPADTMLRAGLLTCATHYSFLSGCKPVLKNTMPPARRGVRCLILLITPLNNRWWLEDRFAAIKKLPAGEQVAALTTIANWEHPGAGGYYDDIGNVANRHTCCVAKAGRQTPCCARPTRPALAGGTMALAENANRGYQPTLAGRLEYNTLDSNGYLHHTGYRFGRLPTNH